MRDGEWWSDSDFVFHLVGATADVLADFIEFLMFVCENVALQFKVLKLFVLSLIFVAEYIGELCGSGRGLLQHLCEIFMCSII